MTVDFKSLLVVFGPINLLLPIFALLALRRFNFAPLRSWFAGTTLLAISFLLIAARTHLPIYLGFDLAQAIAMLSAWLCIRSLNEVLGRKGVSTVSAILLIALYQLSILGLRLYAPDRLLIIFIHSVYILLDYILIVKILAIQERQKAYGLKIMLFGFLVVITTNSTRILMQVMGFYAGTLMNPGPDAIVSTIGGLSVALTANFGFFSYVLEVINNQKHTAESLAAAYESALQSIQRQKELELLISEREHLLQVLSHGARVDTVEALSSSISHEMKQPLANILLNAELARKQILEEDLDKQELKQTIDAIIESNLSATTLLDRIRSAVKKEDILIAPFDLKDCIEAATALSHLAASRSNIAIRYQQSPRQRFDVLGDQTLLQSVVMNLIRNAIESHQSAPRSNPWIHIRSTLKENKVIIKVEDNGPGISGPLRNQIFKPFTSTKKLNGVGLGLAISKSLMQHMQGELELLPDSSTTIFRITLRTP